VDAFQLINFYSIFQSKCQVQGNNMQMETSGQQEL